MRVQDRGCQYRGRENVAQLAEDYAKARAGGATERDAADSTGVARSTQRYWEARVAGIDASDVEKAFFESPAGVAFLHRLVVALHLVIVFCVGGGIRQVIRILHLTHVSRFVGASIGTHPGIERDVENELGAYGKTERARLGQRMAPKAITVCGDENFHEGICLVAIEPVSNFLLAETYVENRTAETWSATVVEAIKGLPVTVEQVTSDEGKALLSLARTLNARHATDLFHVQYETSGAMSLPLAHRVNVASDTVDEADAQVTRAKEQRAAWEKSHGPGRPPNFDLRECAVDEGLVEAKLALEEATQWQADARGARRGLATDYHPVDLATGEPRTAEQIAAKMQERFDALKRIATEAGLSERSMAGLAKAERLLPTLKASLAFFHERVDRRVAALTLPPEQAGIVTTHLVPAAYLERAANRAQLAADKEALRDTAHERRRAGLHALLAAGVDEPQRDQLSTVAAECADLFQRTSSCVEGRNGQHALHHHHLHQVSTTRLEALTVIHNYVIRRPDGTTAAERFFGHKPNDLLDHLLKTVRVPPRPRRAAQRPSPAVLHSTPGARTPGNSWAGECWTKS